MGDFAQTISTNKLVAKIPSVALGIFAFLLVAFSLRSYDFMLKKEIVPVAPPKMIERISFGFHEVIADGLWIRSVQGFDYCDQTKKKACVNNSWLYLMLDAVTSLSPHFRTAYSVGGLALTVILSDVEGATKIFEKGTQAFPNDWPILYRAGYHYLYELGDKQKAAGLFRRAADNGGPAWLYSLAGRLFSDSGNIQIAEALLREIIKSEQDPIIIERLRQKIESMKKNAQ
jgi:tetratricopeptide (TPR) repeat protein